jgi:hypothetical protein
VVRVRLSNVRTEGDELVTLRFAPDGVQVERNVPARQKAARICAGGLILGAGLVAVAASADSRGIDALRLGSWIAAAVVVLIGVVGGGLWWLLLALRGRSEQTSAIPASSVLSARSEVANGQVTVSVKLAGEPDRAFTASGHAGTVLSTQFGRLLSAAPDPS